MPLRLHVKPPCLEKRPREVRVSWMRSPVGSAAALSHWRPAEPLRLTPSCHCRAYAGPSGGSLCAGAAHGGLDLGRGRGTTGSSNPAMASSDGDWHGCGDRWRIVAKAVGEGGVGSD
ncbi:hypothetical protein E2562_031461 [Oryza meyeriana var. granulata]|uniref:Uncharacterized protein n=1 Tax=Oryza meyeriana var. granulata TaxID=110450 RepID=A0A6G1BN38_9ORYZ|nr:hypothetical protein E2562_031461 [Oryza meyeriana var. granulata]